jgi:phage terminase large subunit GpA-like protein
MKRELNIRHVWLRDGEKIDRDGNRFGAFHDRASFWMEGLRLHIRHGRR